MQTIKDQTQAVMAEFRNDAIKLGSKISSPGFAESTFEGTVFKCILSKGRIYWYVDGKLVSQVAAAAAMEQALTRQDQRVTEAQQRATANAAQVAGPEVMIAAQDVKQGDTYVTLFGDARIVECVTVDAQGKIIIDLTGNTARAHNKGEIITVIRAKMEAQEVKPAPPKAQAGMIPEEEKSAYLRVLQAQRKALRLKHGIKWQGGEVCQWQTSRRLRPQVAKQLAKLDALIQVATRGWHDNRIDLEIMASDTGRHHSYSTAKLYKQGKYGHNLLGS